MSNKCCKFEDAYSKKLSAICKIRQDIVRDIINAQIVEMNLQLAHKGVAETIFGIIKFINGEIVLTQVSDHVNDIIHGNVRSQDIITEMSMND